MPTESTMYKKTILPIFICVVSGLAIIILILALFLLASCNNPFIAASSRVELEKAKKLPDTNSFAWKICYHLANDKYTSAQKEVMANSIKLPKFVKFNGKVYDVKKMIIPLSGWRATLRLPKVRGWIVLKNLSKRLALQLKKGDFVYVEGEPDRCSPPTFGDAFLYINPSRVILRGE